jgi:hypothetical protein
VFQQQMGGRSLAAMVLRSKLVRQAVHPGRAVRQIYRKQFVIEAVHRFSLLSIRIAGVKCGDFFA